MHSAKSLTCNLMIKYSFVIPTYNNLTALINLLASIKAMDVPLGVEYEVIVVDDGSSDGTYEYIVNSAIAMVKAVRIPRSEASSRARARNTGALASKGKIINFLDSDITVSHDHLAQLERYYSVSEHVVLVGNRIFMITDPVTGEIVPSRERDFRLSIYANQSFNVSAISYPWSVTYSCNLSVERSNFLKVGGFDENFIEWGLEDLELGYRCERHGLKICNSPFMKVHHLGNDNRINLLEEGTRHHGYMKNINYFTRKHELHSRYPGINIPELLIHGHEMCKTIWHRSENLAYVAQSDDDIKMTIEKKISSGNVVVFDDCEETDLDVWASVHPKRKNIFYFPLKVLRENGCKIVSPDRDNGAN